MIDRCYCAKCDNCKPRLKLGYKLLELQDLDKDANDAEALAYAYRFEDALEEIGD